MGNTKYDVHKEDTDGLKKLKKTCRNVKRELTGKVLACKDNYSNETEGNVQQNNMTEESSAISWISSGLEWEMDKADTFDLFFIRFDTCTPVPYTNSTPTHQMDPSSCLSLHPALSSPITGPPG